MTLVEDICDHAQIEYRLGANFASINYLTHIDPKRKFAYVETPKVACTSIKKYMMDQVVEGVFHLENKNEVHNRAISPLAQLSEMTTNAALGVWGPDYRRFSFVRNPFSRLLSGYLDKLITNEYERKRHLPLMGFDEGYRPTLHEFLERLALKPDAERDIHFRSQTALLMIRQVEYDFIGRFESFERDLLWLQSAYYGATTPKETYEDFGMHHASNANNKIAEYYGDTEAELVRSIYAEDFANFDYPTEISRASEQQLPVRIAALGR